MTEQQTAVVVATPGFTPREVIRLGDYDRSRFNVLIPGAFTSQVTPFLVPVAREYTLDPDPEHGEVYVQEWRKQGNEFVAKAMGINALGLSNLANLAGILEIPQASGRVDDGRDPRVCTYRSTMFMRLPDGQPIIRTRELTLDLDQLYEEITDRLEKKGRENKWNGRPDPWKPERLEAEIKKEKGLARKFFHRKCETGSKARTHRVMLGIRSKYKPDEIARPFVLAAVVPDVNQPEMRERMLDQATSSIGMLFGGQPGGNVGQPARQLSAGATSTPGADDIGAAVGEAGDPKPSAEELAELAGGLVHPDDGGDDPGDDGAAAVPSWARNADATTEPAAATGPKPLAELLGDSAAASDLQGAVKPAQEKALEKLMAGLDWDAEIVPVLTTAFSEAAARSLSAGQAAAIITVANSFDSPAAFVEAWRAAAA